jgi:hypothetical protein
MAQPRMKKEDERAFEMEQGGRQYRIAKKDLSPEMLARIRGYADGGGVEMPYPAVDPLTGQPQVYAYDPRVNDVVLAQGGLPVAPQAPESGTAVFQMPGEEAVAVESPSAAARSLGEPPMRSGAAAASPLARAFEAMKPAPGEPSARQVESQLVNMPTDAAMAAEKAKPKSLMTEEQHQATTSAAEAAAPVPAPPPFRAGRLGQPGTEQFKAGVAQEKAGAQALAESKASEGAALAAQLEGQARESERFDMERQQRTNAAHQQTQEILARHRAAVDEMKNVNTTVDPGRYWASKSTGQKILGILGLAVGALGATRDGINKAAAMMRQAIDRDIDAQKAEYQLALQKGQKAVDALQSDYAMARASFSDELSALNAAKASAMERASLAAKKVSLEQSAPQAKARAQMFIGQMDQKAGDYLNDAARGAFTANLQAKQLEQSANKPAGGMDQKQQAQLFEISEREKEIQQSGAELLSLLKQYGTGEVMSPGVEAKMNQAINGMIIASAKMQDREGVVREPDEAREKKSLGFEPGFFQRGESARIAIESYMKNADRRRNNALSVRGLR